MTKMALTRGSRCGFAWRFDCSALRFRQDPAGGGKTAIRLLADGGRCGGGGGLGSVLRSWYVDRWWHRGSIGGISVCSRGYDGY